MPQVAFVITGSNSNQFVDFKTDSFKTLNITNSDSETITVNVVFGKDDNSGQTSITNGIYILQGVSIPQGVSMQLSNMTCRGINDKLGSGINADDFTLLISCGAANKVASIFLDY